MKRFSVVLMALAVLAPAGVTLAVPIPALAQGLGGTGLGPEQVRALRMELSVAISGLTNARGAAAAADRRAAISRANLTEVGRLLGLPPSTPPSDIVEEAERWVESYQTVVQQLDETRQVLVRIQSGEVRTAGDHYLQRAQAALAAGRLSDADEAFAQLQTVLQTARQEVEDFAADPTAARVALALLQGQPLRAAELADAEYDRLTSERDQRWTRAMEAADAYREADRRASALDGNRWLLLAIERYRDRALRYVDRRSRPDDWAATQNNLGIALRTLGERESGTARLEEAVAAYEAALLERTRERAPLDWAATQNNLGNALLRLWERERGMARLEEAVVAYEAALLELTRDGVPLEWAATQNNLGNALAMLGGRESGTARLEEAVAAYEAALLERTRERVPLDWAMTQNNLGNALEMLGGRESGTARLEQAVAAYEAALLERTRERMPLGWATTQYNLGNALSTLGQRESGMAFLEKAVVAYRASLEESTRERVPLDWAGTQYTLGNALSTLGQRESGTAFLEEAVEAYQAALLELTRDGVPLDWALIKQDMALVRNALFDRTGDVADLDAALADAREALEVYEVAGADQDVETSRSLVENLEAKRAALP